MRQLIAAILFVVFGAPEAQEYQTVRGDTLQNAADELRMSVEELASANPDVRLRSGETVTDGGIVTDNEVAAPLEQVAAIDLYSQPTPVPPSSNENEFTAYVTGYGSPDNDCGGRGGDCTWYDGKEGHAGGDGTYDHPIALAVGEHSGYEYGQIFYLPYLKAYVKAQDTCASCDAGKQGRIWIDAWHGQDTGPEDELYDCQSAHTGFHTVIQDPAPDHTVVVGGLFERGVCRRNYGD